MINMQDLGFVFKNAEIDLGGFSAEVTLYSFTNAYSLDPKKTTVSVGDGTITAEASGLLTHGGQTTAEGTASVRIHRKDERWKVSISAGLTDCTEEIRSVKLSLSGFSNGNIINLIDSRPCRITAEGSIFNYPEGWRSVGTPLMVLTQPTGRFLYFRSLDNEVRRKTFTFALKEETIRAELIFEENAVRMSSRINVPQWEFGFSDSAEAIYEEHDRHVESAYGLKAWDKRKDVPQWARKISLIAAIHGQHWTGYIYNDYRAILDTLKRLCELTEGSEILAYLPGWEGRYYWKYGCYGPDERMGGEKGLHLLADGARELGVHLMPMYGINIAGTHHQGFMEWGNVSEVHSASGNLHQGSVDWDGSRHYDHGSGRTLNPAAPKWQNRLVEQIVSLSREYGFDAAFLDIAAFWENDPNHEVYPGVCRMVERLHEGLDDFLVAGEGWYDALPAAIPLLQCGHTDGVLHWHDDSNPRLFDRYARNFAHLCLGDPSRMSTGVHEQGTATQWETPLRKGVIPTLTIVDGTMENAKQQVEEAVNQAKEYSELYLNK